jgi:hypothetical protein
MLTISQVLVKLIFIFQFSLFNTYEINNEFYIKLNEIISII